MEHASTASILMAAKGDQIWRYVLRATEVQIGRGSQNDVTLIDDLVSRRHATLRRQAGSWQISDLGSANGTRVNGRQIDQPATVTAGDRIAIGGFELWLAAPDLRADGDETRLDATALADETEVDAPADARNPLAPAAAGAFVDVILPDTQIARLAVHFNGRTWETPLSEAGLGIGRGAECDVVLDHPRISRRHARIELRDGIAELTDAGSANGTFVDNARVTHRALTGGEVIRIGPALLVFKPAFKPNQLLDATQPRAALERRPIVFVPGFMGSQLWDGETLAWPNLRLLFQKPEVLKLSDARALTVRGLVEDVVVVPGLFKLEQYSQLTEFLNESLGYTTGVDLLPFAYDWRNDLRIAARQLRDAVASWRMTLPNPDQKVILIAHSMGCLVARYFLDVLGGDQATERVILMGGPQLGTPKIVLALLTGKGLLPRGLLGNQVRDAVSTFHGAYQLLPAYPTVFDRAGNPIDVFADPRWADRPFQKFVQDARVFRNELSPVARRPTLCIVGYGNTTVTKAVVDVDADGRWRQFQFVEDEEGDSTIPVSSAILEGADFHPVQQSHGALFVDNDVKYRLKLELTK